MDKTQGLIVALLILAILFSIASIYTSFSATKGKISEGGISANVVSDGAGGVALEVKKSQVEVDYGK